MKTLFKTIFALALAVSVSSCEKKNQEPEKTQPETFKVMSFNIRTGTSDRGTANAWEVRKAGVYEMLKSEQPLIVGLQEARKFQRTEILEACPNFAGFGVCRDTGQDVEGETGSVIYDKNQCSIEKYGYFWLTEKDTSKPNVGWDATYKRMATWAVVKVTKSGQRFFFMNTHLDHQVEAAKVNGIELIKQKIAELNVDNLPVALTGDFNSEPTQAWMVSLNEMLGDCRKDSPLTDNFGTSHGYGKKNQLIDHIYYKDFTPLSYETIRNKWSGVTYISDHYPVMAKFNFTEGK